MEENKGKKAIDIFREGYNCAQSVVIAYSEECGLTHEVAANISAPFGGGLGRQREVCGAVSGMSMVLGALTKFNSEDKNSSRTAIFATTQSLCSKFRESHGSIVCREIKKSAITDEASYARTSCEKCVEDAAMLIETEILNK